MKTKQVSKPKILFVYDHKYPELWRDGLWAALNILEKDFEIERFNIAKADRPPIWNHDFLLGWGAFKSRVDTFIQKSKDMFPFVKCGLCIAGNAFPPDGMEKYDVLFYETEWYKPQIENHPNIIHAFGINTQIYNPTPNPVKIWDYLSVGAFALWKRLDKLIDKPGTKFVIGEIQRDNAQESWNIIVDLLASGIAVSDMVYPTRLREIYNASRCVYIASTLEGGGERAVLEGRACGCRVEIESDNPKLEELISSPIWTEKYYYEKLKEGITSCL